MIKGVPVFDSLKILEIETVDFSQGNSGVTLTAHAAFVNTRNGTTHGHTKGATWSTATIQKLAELVSSMESDMASQHFSDLEDTGSGDSPIGSHASGPSGIGEHATPADVPSI